jgi:hypothetical protein
MAHSQKRPEVLKAKLAFLDEGGYHARPRYPWRPNSVFQDSPTCLTSRTAKSSGLARGPSLVPERPSLAVISFCFRDETVNSFYPWGTEEELEPKSMARAKHSRDGSTRQG